MSDSSHLEKIRVHEDGENDRGTSEQGEGEPSWVWMSCRASVIGIERKDTCVIFMRNVRV